MRPLLFLLDHLAATAAQAQAQLQEAVKGKPGGPAKQEGETATQRVAVKDPTLDGAGRQPLPTKQGVK